MNSNNPLEPVFRAFSVASDCFKVAERTIQIQHEELIRRTEFIGATPEQANAALDGAVKQAADLAILALFATFERCVIEHLQTANRLFAAGYPQQYSTRLSEKFESEVEYWRFGEVLDLFKSEVDSNLIGQVKQIKQYRDWIAHQNPNKPTPTQATPETTFDVLTRMIEQIRLTHTPPPADEAVDDIVELAPVQ
ncbi:hypothetical protein B0G57_116106 [Trinickia symbiotica]|uniref:RiboL-PSP-HEPN domain-containing protein n=1 Tax=Trinickia symbiotica TaxID=863227 RepID=A0A2N7X6Y3_9BURK|nr:hypothetical protein [Trinickia symbiotica]PMS37341.1 hypothetical protein C0Z20_08490 [Trinickia symbiotica]PPK42855.1 hypothetical protein B0G57_116106 [Trinickia symbiotica]